MLLLGYLVHFKEGLESLVTYRTVGPRCPTVRGQTFRGPFCREPFVIQRELRSPLPLLLDQPYQLRVTISTATHTFGELTCAWIPGRKTRENYLPHFFFLPGSLLKSPALLCHPSQVPGQFLHDLLLDDPGAPYQPQLGQVALLTVDQLLQHLGHLLCMLLYKP